ncbi:hypothetical protein BH11BAC3_BH11BAC3_47620 [soil metagenome]
MKKILIFLSCCCLLTHLANAQPKQKAAKEFLTKLNSILKNSPSQHWGYEGAMTIDSAFAISPAGILSVTVRYTNDSSFMRARMEAPVSKIKGALYDLYLILECAGDDVTIYQSEDGSNELKVTNKTHLFHVGEPTGDGYWEKENLEKLLDKLLKFY